LSRAPLLGFHVSIKDSLPSAFDNAAAFGCNTFQMFTRNPRGWAFKPLPPEVAAAFREKRDQPRFPKIVVHMPYLPNLASPDPATIKLSRASLSEEVKRCDALGVDYLVTHIGSHLGKGPTEGVKNVAAACDQALAGSRGRTTILLENMAGQKNCVGARFEELASIIKMTKHPGRVGVCLDTCHAYAAGFDLSSRAAVKTTLGLVDELLGLDRVRVVHLNDSKGKLGSGLDRHEDIGKGFIGREGFRALINNDAFSALPFILETPYDDDAQLKNSLSVARKLFSS
jgi:deoxyribonuclease IV